MFISYGYKKKEAKIKSELKLNVLCTKISTDKKDKKTEVKIK